MTVSLKQLNNEDEQEGALPSAAPHIIYWGCHDSPLGPLLLGVSDEGVSRLEFASGYGLAYDLGEWKKEWPSTTFIADSSRTAILASKFSHMNPHNLGLGALALYGTAFQLKVWKAMLHIEPGKTMSYSEMAGLVGKPQAARAVALALNNPPPHVVTSSPMKKSPTFQEALHQSETLDDLIAEKNDLLAALSALARSA